MVRLCLTVKFDDLNQIPKPFHASPSARPFYPRVLPEPSVAFLCAAHHARIILAALRAPHLDIIPHQNFPVRRAPLPHSDHRIRGPRPTHRQHLAGRPASIPGRRRAVTDRGAALAGVGKSGRGGAVGGLGGGRGFESGG